MSLANMRAAAANPEASTLRSGDHGDNVTLGKASGQNNGPRANARGPSCRPFTQGTLSNQAPLSYQERGEYVRISLAQMRQQKSKVSNDAEGCLLMKHHEGKPGEQLRAHNGDGEEITRALSQPWGLIGGGADGDPGFSCVHDTIILGPTPMCLFMQAMLRNQRTWRAPSSSSSHETARLCLWLHPHAQFVSLFFRFAAAVSGAAACARAKRSAGQSRNGSGAIKHLRLKPSFYR